jgi:hypothetical protein
VVSIPENSGKESDYVEAFKFLSGRWGHIDREIGGEGGPAFAVKFQVMNFVIKEVVGVTSIEFSPSGRKNDLG